MGGKDAAARASKEWQQYEKSAKSRKYRTEVRFDESWAKRAWRAYAPNPDYPQKSKDPLVKIDQPPRMAAMLKAIVEYDKAKKIDYEKVDGGSDLANGNLLAKHLGKILKETNSARGEVQKLVVDNTEKKGMLKLLDETERLAKEEFDDLSKAMARADAEYAPLKRETLSQIVWKGDLKKLAKKYLGDYRAAGFQISLQPIIVSVRLTDTMARELETQGAVTRLYRMIERQMDGAAKGLARDLKDLLASNKANSNLNQAKLNKTRNTLQSEVDKILAKHEAELKSSLSALPDTLLAGLGLQKKYAKHYQRDRVVDVVKSGTGVAVSIAATAAPGAAPLALLGVVRSAAALSQDVAKFTDSLSAKTKQLSRQLNELNKSFRGVNLEKAIEAYDAKHANKRGARRARELGGSFINGVIGIDMVTTCSTAAATLSDLEGNYHRSSRSHLKLELKLEKVLTKAAKAEKMYSSILVQNANPNSKEFVGDIKKDHVKSKDAKALKNLRNKLQETLEKSYKLAKELRQVEETVPGLKSQLKQLSDMNSTALENWSKVSKLAGGLSVSALGLADAATGAYTAAGEVEVVISNTVVAMTSDAESFVEDVFL